MGEVWLSGEDCSPQGISRTGPKPAPLAPLGQGHRGLNTSGIGERYEHLHGLGVGGDAERRSRSKISARSATSRSRSSVPPAPTCSLRRGQRVMSLAQPELRTEHRTVPAQTPRD